MDWGGRGAAATLIGVVGSLVALLPRVTVEATGELSNPASIAFVARNTGPIPLGYPVVTLHSCEIILNSKPQDLHGGCDRSRPPPPDLDNGMRSLYPDDTITTRFDDIIYRTNGAMPIADMNMEIRVGYYPWFFPFRFYKWFGFQSAKGSDGELHWRLYTPPLSNGASHPPLTSPQPPLSRQRPVRLEPMLGITWRITGDYGDTLPKPQLSLLAKKIDNSLPRRQAPCIAFQSTNELCSDLVGSEPRTLTVRCGRGRLANGAATN